MEIQIHNFPTELPGKAQNWEELTEHILKEVDLNTKSLNVVFVDDNTLQAMHLEYLNDPQKTDVMTFDLSDGDDLEGEIYISADRAQEQAREYQVSFAEEVLRLIIHGILHLKGYDDLKAEDQKLMKEQEDRLVQIFKESLPE